MPYDPVTHQDVRAKVGATPVKDPITGVLYDPSGVSISGVNISGITNDGTFAQETGGNLTAINTATTEAATDLDEIVLDTDHLAPIDTSTAATATALGAPADASASSDSGTFSLLAFVKRLLAKFPAIGQNTKAASISVTMASDQGTIGSVIANAGTNLNTSALAKESGGNLDAIKTDLDNVVTNTTRVNTDSVVALTSAAITSNSHSSDQTNTGARGVIVAIAPGTFGSGANAIIVTIEGKDPTSGTYYTILASAALVDSTFTRLLVYPGMAAAANVSANTPLPKTWRVRWDATAWGTGGSTLGISYGYSV